MKKRIFTLLMAFLATLNGAIWAQDGSILRGRVPEGGGTVISDWWNGENISIGTLTIEVNLKGIIVSANYEKASSAGYEESNPILEDGTVKFSLGQNDYFHFGSDNNQVVVHGEDWNPSDYFAMNISDKKTLIIGKGSEVFADLSNEFFVKLDLDEGVSLRNPYRILTVAVQKAETDISSDPAFTISWNSEGSGTKVYDAQSVSTEELKKMLTVQYDGKDFEDYSVTVEDDATVKDVSEYTLTITPNKGNSLNLVGSKTTTYKITKATLTVSLKEGTDLDATVNTELTLGAEDFDITTEPEALVTTEGLTLTGSLSVIPTTVGENTISDETLSTALTIQGNEDYKATNYNIIYTPVIFSASQIADNNPSADRKYQLYLANKDYLDYGVTEEYYDKLGLELFSRHNKKYTDAGGSFTIYYEKDGEMNAGDYRIFWSNRANGDYREVKFDEVSGYYQIRNVNSNVYVKIFDEAGFPVANESIAATDVRAYAQAGKIVVVAPEPTDVQIISMAGAVVAADKVTSQREFTNLAEGVYIVRMGETAVKLQVRN